MGARDAWIVLLMVVVAAPRASAQSADSAAVDSLHGRRSLADTILTLPEVRVVERRSSDAARRVPTGFTSEIRPGQRGGAIDLLPELMSRVPGVHVQQYGGLGAFSVMSLRGGSPGQVAVFLDGEPLTAAGRSVVSLADLPITAIEKIEVYRGSTPLGFGMAGAGGAVNLVTPGSVPAPVVRVTRGSFDTWDARGFAARAAGPWSALLHFGYQGSRGDFDYRNDNATPFNSSDDAIVARRNNRFDASTGLARLGWHPLSHLHLVGRGEWMNKRQGTPGLGAAPTLNTSLATGFAMAQLEAAMDPIGRARPGVALRASHDRTRTRFKDPRAELGLGIHDTDDRIDADHLDLDLDWPRLPGASLQAGGTLAREGAALHDAGDAAPDPGPSRRLRQGGMLDLLLEPGSGWLRLSAGERWDRLSDVLRSVAIGGLQNERDVDRMLHAPQLGACLAPGLGFELKANWSKADRPPDFMELFGNQGTVLGNPALRPERVESWDAGAAWSTPALARWSATLTAAHFESRARDLILYTRNSASTVRAMNVTAARVRGEELELSLGTRSLRASGSLTLERARDAGDVPYWTGKRLPQRPGYQGDAQLSWSRGPLGLGADLDALGDNYLDRYNRYFVAGRTLVGAWISCAPGAWPLRLTVEAKNLGDRRTSDVAGFPLPGRSLFVSCESRLGPTTR